jgi:DHA2 family multidrug resistance protein-like MFS transporter
MIGGVTQVVIEVEDQDRAKAFWTQTLGSELAQDAPYGQGRWLEVRTPDKRAGAASALSETSAEFGGALGIAILGVIGTSIYRSQMTDALPAGILPKTAADARDTFGGAVAAAGRLPDQLGQALLRAARQAFTQGLHLAFTTSAAAAIGAAILAAILLRRLRPSSEPQARLDPERIP